MPTANLALRKRPVMARALRSAPALECVSRPTRGRLPGMCRFWVSRHVAPSGLSPHGWAAHPMTAAWRGAVVMSGDRGSAARRPQLRRRA